MAKRRIGSIKYALISKSKEAALSAVKIFNDPLIKFKSETFIVLMIRNGVTSGLVIKTININHVKGLCLSV